MFSSFENIMCLQSLFLSDSGCSGGAYFENDVKFYSSAADCSAGVKFDRHMETKFDSDGLTQTSLLHDGKKTDGLPPHVSDCPEAQQNHACTCDAAEKYTAATQPGRIHFISTHFRILFVT